MTETPPQRQPEPEPRKISEETHTDTDSAYVRAVVMLKQLAAERELDYQAGKSLHDRLQWVRQKIFGKLTDVKGDNPLFMRRAITYSGDRFTPNYFEYPSPEDAHTYMERMYFVVDQLYRQLRKETPMGEPVAEEESLRFASLVYCLGILIHPYLDGNGRTWTLTTLSYLRELNPDFDNLVFPFRHPRNNNFSWQSSPAAKNAIVRQPRLKFVAKEFHNQLDEHGLIELYSQMLKVTNLRDKAPTNLFISSMSPEEVKRGIVLRRDRVAEYLQEHRNYLVEIASLSGVDINDELDDVIGEFYRDGTWSNEALDQIVNILRIGAERPQEKMQQLLDTASHEFKEKLGPQLYQLAFEKTAEGKQLTQQERLRQFLSYIVNERRLEDLYAYLKTGLFQTKAGSHDLNHLAWDKLAEFVLNDFVDQLKTNLQTKEERRSKMGNLGLRLRRQLEGRMYVLRPPGQLRSNR